MNTKYEKIWLDRQNKQHAKDQAYLAPQKAYATSLQVKLLPGQQLLTCQMCKKIVCVPVWQQMVTCVRYGYGSPIHPGEIKI